MLFFISTLKGPSWDIHAQMYQVLPRQSVQKFPVDQGHTLTVQCHFLFSVRTQAHLSVDVQMNVRLNLIVAE